MAELNWNRLLTDSSMDRYRYGFDPQMLKVGADYNGVYIEPKYLQQALNDMLPENPWQVQRRSEAQQAIHTLEGYGRTLRDNLSTTTGALEDVLGGRMTRTAYQTLVEEQKAAAARLREQIQEAARNIGYIDQNYVSDELREFTQQLPDAVNRLESALGRELSGDTRFLFNSGSEYESVRDNPDYAANIHKPSSTRNVPEIFRFLVNDNEDYPNNPFILPEELETYNYLVNTGRLDDAREYRKRIEEDATNRNTIDLLDEDSVSKKLFIKVMGGLSNHLTGFSNIGKILEGSEPIRHTPQTVAAKTMSQNDTGFEKFVGDLAFTTGNMLPSIAAGRLPGIGPVVGPLQMGLSAAGNAATDAMDSGYGRGEAIAYGLINGTLEAGLQAIAGGIAGLGKAPLYKWLGKIPGVEKVLTRIQSITPGFLKTQTGQAVTGVLSNMGKEAAEEWTQEWVDNIVRNVVLGEDNAIGMFSNEAIYAALLGATSAGLMNATGDVPNIVNSVRADWANRGQTGLGMDTASQSDTSIVDNAGTHVDDRLTAGDGVQATPSSLLEQYAQNEAPPIDGSVSPDVSSMALDPYTEQQRGNWMGSRNIVLYESPEQLEAFVNDAVTDKQNKKKLYFGQIPSDIATRIQAETGVEIDGYNVALYADDIRHGMGHWDSDVEALRGQRAITIEDYANIPEIISDPDTISLSENTDNGKPIIEFAKNINGKTTVISYVLKGKHDLGIKTMYAGKSKGSLAGVKGSQLSAPSRTSETSTSTASNTENLAGVVGAPNASPITSETYTRYRSLNESVPQTGENINVDFSQSEGDTDGDADVQARINRAASSEWSRSDVARNPGNPYTSVTLQQIVDKVKGFGVPVSIGRIRQKAAGIYKVRPEAIRMKNANDIEVLAHELGHHFDKTYNLKQLPGLSEAISVLKSDPDFLAASYAEQALPGEAIAEFFRRYLADRSYAETLYPQFSHEFRSRIPSGVLKVLDDIGDMSNAYMLQDTAQRQDAAIVTRHEAKAQERRSKGVKGTAQEIGDKVQKGFDDIYALRFVSPKAYDMGMSIKAMEGIAHQSLTGDLIDAQGNRHPEIKGFSSILKDAGNAGITRKTMDRYLVLRRAVKLSDREIRSFADESLQNKDVMQESIRDIEASHPEIQQIADDLYKFIHAVNRFHLVDTGILSAQELTDIDSKNPDYVPFFRNMEGQIGGSGAFGDIADADNPMRRIKGSGRQILSPLENVAQSTSDKILAGKQQMIKLELASYAANTEGGAALLEQVPPTMEKQVFGTEPVINKLVETMRTDSVTDEQLTDYFTGIIGDNVSKWSVRDNQGREFIRIRVPVRRGGKIDMQYKTYQVHSTELLSAIRTLNTDEPGSLMAMVRKATNFSKLFLTGINPGFAVANTFRDFGTYMTHTSESNPLKAVREYAAAFADVVKRNDVYKDYVAQGGTANTRFSAMENLTSTVRRLIDKKDFKSRMRYFGKDVLQIVSNLVGASEAVPRLAEYRNVLRHGGTKDAASAAAREVTTNFLRGGKEMRMANAAIPYFSASINGVNHLITSIKNNPRKIVPRMVLYSILTSTIAPLLASIMGDEEEYKNLSAYQKNNFYNLSLGDGKFIRLPKSQGESVLTSLFERAWETLLMENPDAFYDFSGYLSNIFIPPGLPSLEQGMDGLTVDVTNSLTDIVIIGPMAETVLNRDFRGAPIVPPSVEGRMPNEQYTEYTSWYAKTIAKTLNVLPVVGGVSPMHVDHVVNSYFGDYGKVLNALTAENKDYSLNMSRRFSSDSVYSNDTVTVFYNKAELFERMANSYPDDLASTAMSKEYASGKSVMSALNRLQKEDESRETKRLYRDFAVGFQANAGDMDERLMRLYEDTRDNGVLPFLNFDNRFTVRWTEKEKINGREVSREKSKDVVLDAVDFLSYVEDATRTVDAVYDDILSSTMTSEQKAAALSDAKVKAKAYVQGKWANKEVESGVMKAFANGVPANLYYEAKYRSDADGNGSISQSELRKYFNQNHLTQYQKSILWNAFGSNWKSQPYGSPDAGTPSGSGHTDSSINDIWRYAFG